MPTDNTRLTAIERFLDQVPEAETWPERIFTKLAKARRFGQTLEDYREQANDAARLKAIESQYLRPILLDLIELRDRQADGIEAVTRLRPSWLVRLMCRRKRLKFQAVLDGLQLTLERLDQLLASLEVTPLPAGGQRFDPATMRAVEAVCRRDLPGGQVVAVLRRGWRWRGEVLRPAEVKVNKGAR